ncbi:TonB-dependent siderophore receptor [Peristeroidobacter soli]|uniref:TonB-dependent siderophore receptor n=1 Tax=Peristeroidobacter soli TaxID=2497877 RepID=UPI00101CF912|nr:TonB-dependent siderophore receptor [Peristeroidobacter soli]
MRTLLVLILWGPLSLVHTSCASAAQSEQQYLFDVAAGSLRNALIAFSQRTHLQVVYTDPRIAKARTHGVHGQMSASAALDALLSGTGLSFEIDRRSVRIFEAARRNVSPASPAGASARRDSVEEVIVLGVDPRRYDIEATTTLTGFPLSFLELPRTVEIIPEQVLLDQKALDLTEALQNVTGVTFSDGFGGTNDDFLVRGFRRNSVYRDGFRRGSIFRINTVNVERIEVIKGPASIAFGQLPPGGVVNVITKKPSAQPRTILEGRMGSYDTRFALLDSSFPIHEQDATMRVNLSWHEAASFRDFTQLEQGVLALASRWQTGPRTRVEASYEYRNESRPVDRGLLTLPDASGGRYIPDLPRGRRLGEPFEQLDLKLHFLQADVTHDIAEKWQAQFGLLHERSEADDLQVRPVEVTAQGMLSRRVDGSLDRSTRAWYGRASLVGALTHGAMEHRLSAGFDFRYLDQDRRFATGATLAGFDIFAPVYGQLSPELTDVSAVASRERDHGAYVQDYFTPAPWISLLLGLRGERVYSASVFGARSANTGDIDVVSPHAGLVLRPGPRTSLWVNYAEAFEPNLLVTETQTALDTPRQSWQIELGVKSQAADDRLSVSLALFDIESRHIAVGSDAVDSADFRARGVEITLAGQPWRGANVIAGYSRSDMDILYGSLRGRRPQNTADYTFNFWASYEPHDGRWHGLGVGAGVFCSGDRYGNNANTWSLGAYTLVNASLWYNLPLRRPSGAQLGQARLQLAVKNLFDEHYFPSSGGDLRVEVGRPRSVLGSVTLTF